MLKSHPSTLNHAAFTNPFRPNRRRGQRAVRAIGALVLREMATTYGRSPGGWLWAVMEPVAAIALLSFAFSLVFVAPPLGRDFALFYATGFLPFFLFLDVSQKGASALRFSRPLLGFSGVTWVDALLARFMLNTLTQIAVTALLLSALICLSRRANLPAAEGVALALTMAVALAVGVGTLNAYLTSAFPIWERCWSVLMRPMFIISGVIFLFEDVPRTLQPWLALNPLFHVTGAMRAAFYPSYQASYLDPVYVFALALGLAVTGACLLSHLKEEGL